MPVPLMPRQILSSVFFVCAVFLVCATALPPVTAGAAPGSGGNNTTADTVVETVTDTVADTDAVTDTTAGWRIENDPSECLGFLPKPGCGYEPTDAGERGGSLQITLFLVMIGALAVIGTVIARNIVRRDRAMSAVAEDGTADAG